VYSVVIDITLQSDVINYCNTYSEVIVIALHIVTSLTIALHIVYSVVIDITLQSDVINYCNTYSDVIVIALQSDVINYYTTYSV